MGKYGKYKKKYKKDWEAIPEFRGWLTKSNDLDKEREALCTVGKVVLRAHKTDLKKHSLTQMHKVNAAALHTTKQPKIIVVRDQSIQLKKGDISLAVYTPTANHTSIKSIDHLGEMLSELGKGSILEELRLHRTKCSSLILNDIAPSLLDEILAEIGNAPYYILLDESTDIGDDKYMAYCVRYFSSKRNKMIVDFLGFHKVIRATAQQLYENFLAFLNHIKLKPENMIAVATDGANNMCGKNRSLFTLLQQQISKIATYKMCLPLLEFMRSKIV